MAEPWAESETVTLRALHGQGLSLGRIAKQMGRSRETVARRASEGGLQWDRSLTEAATKAAVADAKARRTMLSLAILGDLEEARLRIGTSESAREFQSASQGMDALMRSYVSLVRMEPDDGGLGEAQSIVGRILAAVSLSVEGLPRLNPTAPRAEV
jgi:hypothetical protein